MNKIILVFILLSSTVFGQSLEKELSAKRENSKKMIPADIKKIMARGVKGLNELGLHKKALGVGKKAPLVSFRNLKKRRVSLQDLANGKTLVLTFYRGGWCPYCMLELDAYELMKAKFEKAGAQVVAVSPDSVAQSLKTKKKRHLSIELLSDPENRAAKAFGLAFKLDEDTLGVYKKFGIDLKSSQGNSNNELPMPGTYVIDKRGVIRFSFVDPDYTKRAEPTEVLKVVNSL